MSDLQEPAGPDVSGLADGAPVASPRSLVDAIRRRHEHKERTLDLFPPRWEGDVAIRCGRVPRKVLATIGKGTSTQQASKLVVAACREVLLRDEDGRLQSLNEPGQPPVGLDPRLAQLFDLDPASPLVTCMGLYADDVPLIAQAQELFDWITGKSLDIPDLEALEEELGEETAAS